MESGARMWQSELSIIDTAWLLAGALVGAAYFSATTPAEVELRTLADSLYRRVDWRWAQHNDGAVVLGWKPECGFLHYGWEGYSEALLLYALGLGSPTHPLTKESFHNWTLTYQWENLYGYDLLYAGPLFIHQYSHAWIDFRGIRDRFMREKHCDYFENSRRATLVQREYAIRNPRGFAGYGADCWGLSASDGPSSAPQMVAGRRQAFYGYAARGAPFGPDDGTISGPAMLASLVFAPHTALPAIRNLHARASGAAAGGVRAAGDPGYTVGAGNTADASDSVDGPADQRLRAGGFNATDLQPAGAGWLSPGEFGLDQGLISLMIENYRTGLPWRLGRRCGYLVAGLRRAGFSGGWL
jgi:hypothetical protein